MNIKKNHININDTKYEIVYSLPLHVFNSTSIPEDLQFIHSNIILILKIKGEEYKKLMSLPNELNLLINSFDGEDYEINIVDEYYCFKHTLFTDDIFIKMDEIPELKRRVRELKISKIKNDY